MAQATRDAHGRPLVAVTGMGVVTSLGEGQADTWAALTAGRSGIHALAASQPRDCAPKSAARWISSPSSRSALPCSRNVSRLGGGRGGRPIRHRRKGDFPGALFMAVPPVEIEWPQRQALAEASGQNDGVTYADLLKAAATGRFKDWHELFIFGTVADHIADRFGTKGSPISLSTACSSGATAIQLGVEAIRRGEMDAALCIGTDGSVNPELLIRFSLLSALSTQNDPPEGAAKPFSKNRDGFVMGEGAAALVSKTPKPARARAPKILGYVLGCGEKGDGFHRTRSSPDGAPIIAAIRGRTRDAGLIPDDIDYINAHGTGTPENDKMEALGCMAVLGERMKGVPISSNKSMVGHTLTAAGAVEAVFSLLTIRNGRIPPTINYNVPDPAIPLDVVPNQARDATVSYVMSNSFGFGGQNTCLVFGAEPA